jgi:hypothetical protein
MHDIFHPLPDEPTIVTAEKEALLDTGRKELPPSLFNYLWETLQVWIDQEVALRASVGSTDASASLPARVGVVGPKRASSWAIQLTTRFALGPGKRQRRVHDPQRQ